MNCLRHRVFSVFVTAALVAEPMPAIAVARPDLSASLAVFQMEAFSSRAPHFLQFAGNPEPKIQSLVAATSVLMGKEPGFPLLGGAATVAGDITPEQHFQIQQAIDRYNGNPREIDLSKIEGLDAELAGLIRQMNLYVVPEFHLFDYFLIAHGGAGGEVTHASDPHHLKKHGIYFSPKRFEAIQLLTPYAQIEFWRHEILGHVKHPKWSEQQVLDKYPLDWVCLDMAYHLTVQVNDTIREATQDLDSLARSLDPQYEPVRRRLSRIAALLRDDRKQLLTDADALRGAGDPLGERYFRQADADFLKTPGQFSWTWRRKEAASFLLRQEIASLPKSESQNALLEVLEKIEYTEVAARDAGLNKIFQRTRKDQKITTTPWPVCVKSESS